MEFSGFSATSYGHICFEQLKIEKPCKIYKAFLYYNVKGG
jgi:hypothetical protein